MNLLVDKIWSVVRYLRRDMSNADVMNLILTSIFLFRHKPTVIDKIQKLAEKESPQIDSLKRLSKHDNFTESDVDISNIIEVLEYEFKSLNNSEELLGVFSELDVFYSLENNPKSWIAFILDHFKIKEKASGLKNLSQSDYDKIFGILLERFSLIDKERIFFTPASIQKIQNALIPNSESIFDPAVGYGNNFSYYLENFGTKCFGIEKNSRIWAINKLRFSKREQITIKLGDSLEESSSRGEKFNNVITTPPFLHKHKGGIKSISGDFLWLQLALHHLKEEGLALVTTKRSPAFSDRISDIEFKSNIIKNNKLAGLIFLPSGIFNNTEMNTVMWVLAKKSPQKEKILFFDAGEKSLWNRVNRNTDLTEESISLIKKTFNSWIDSATIEAPAHIAKAVHIKDIESNNFTLTPGIYLKNKNLEKFDLSKTSELSSIISRKGSITNDSRGTNPIRKISIKDLSERPDKYLLNIKEVALNEHPLRNNRYYSGAGLLVSFIGDKLRPTFINPSQGELYLLRNIAPFDLNTDLIHPEYLIQELNEDYVKFQLDALTYGSIQRLIKTTEFLKIRINVPSLKKQHSIVQSRKLGYIEKAQKELKNYQKELGIETADANSYLRHQVAGSLKNLRGAYKVFDTIIKEHLLTNHPEIMDLKANPKHTKTFRDQMHIFERDLKKVTLLVKNSNKEFDVKSAIMSEVKIIELIKKKTEEMQDRESEIEFNLYLDEEDFKNDNLAEVIIDGNKDLIVDALDNLIENAIKHAFIEFEGKKEITIQISLPHKSDLIQIDVSNTGNPVRENFDFNTFTRNGGRLGKNAGDGFGGWYINEIMKKHEGSIQFKNEHGSDKTYSDLVSTFELYFPIKEILKDD